MEEGDLASILEIENLSFTNPWHASAFKGEMDNYPISFPFVIVHRSQEKIIGYIIIWNINEEAQISNFAIHPDFRRLGIGETVMREVLVHFRKAGMKHMILEVRPSNLAASSLYENLGFSVLGIRKNYYRNPPEDAIIMGKKL